MFGCCGLRCRRPWRGRAIRWQLFGRRPLRRRAFRGRLFGRRPLRRQLQGRAFRGRLFAVWRPLRRLLWGTLPLLWAWRQQLLGLFWSLLGLVRVLSILLSLLPLLLSLLLPLLVLLSLCRAVGTTGIYRAEPAPGACRKSTFECLVLLPRFKGLLSLREGMPGRLADGTGNTSFRKRTLTVCGG
jgi:hypothetical protein